MEAMTATEQQRTNLELFFFMEQLQTITRLPLFGFGTSAARLDLTLSPGDGEWKPYSQQLDPTDFVLSVPLLWWGTGAGHATVSNGSELIAFKAAANILYSHYRPEDAPIRWDNVHNDWAILTLDESLEFARLLPEVFVILYCHERPPVDQRGDIPAWDGFPTDGDDGWLREALNAFGKRMDVWFNL